MAVWVGKQQLFTLNNLQSYNLRKGGNSVMIDDT